MFWYKDIYIWEIYLYFIKLNKINVSLKYEQDTMKKKHIKIRKIKNGTGKIHLKNTFERQSWGKVPSGKKGFKMRGSIQEVKWEWGNELGDYRREEFSDTIKDNFQTQKFPK